MSTTPSRSYMDLDEIMRSLPLDELMILEYYAL